MAVCICGPQPGELGSWQDQGWLPQSKGSAHLGNRTGIPGFRPHSHQKYFYAQVDKNSWAHWNQQADVSSFLSKSKAGLPSHMLRPSLCRRFLNAASECYRQKWHSTWTVDSKTMQCPVHCIILLLELFLILKAQLECCLVSEVFPSPPHWNHSFSPLWEENSTANLFLHNGMQVIWVVAEVFTWSLLLDYKLTESRDCIMTVWAFCFTH